MDKYFEQAELLSKMWTDFAGKMASAGFSVPPGTAPPEAARQMRSAFFAAWGQALDEFMRSPQSLAMMKQSMDAAIAMRKQFNDTLTQWRHELQGTASEDIDNVILSVRHLEQRVLDAVEGMNRRVEELAGKVEQLAEQAGDAGTPSDSNGEGELKRPGGAARKGAKKQD